MYNFSNKKEVKIKIGNLCLSMQIDSAYILDRVRLHYKDFISSNKPNFYIEVKYGDFLKPNFKELLCQSRSWQLGKEGRNIVFYFPKKDGPSLARFDTSLNYVTFYTLDYTGQLLLYLLPELLCSMILPQNNSLMVHACGVLSERKGYLFIAPPGGGKSTIAKLAGKRIVLNDDRIIINRKYNFFKIYGNPWHGEVEKTANQSTQIDEIFFLEKADRNYILPLKIGEAVVKLINNSFWLPITIDVTGNVFGFCYQIAGKRACYRLGFRPDKSIWRYLDGVAKEGSY